MALQLNLATLVQSRDHMVEGENQLQQVVL